MTQQIDRIGEPWGTRTPYGPGETWPARVDTHLGEGLAPDDVDHWAQSASILHSNGDALDIAVKDGHIVGVRGRFLEEYYTLGLIAHGGIGTNHVDGNTRLCTATAAAALK